MRKVFFVLFLALTASVYGQTVIPNGVFINNPEYASADKNLCFKFLSNNQIETFSVNSDDYDPEMDNLDAMPKRNRLTGTYRITNENGVDFISIQWSNNTSARYLLLLLPDGIPLLYSSDARPYFSGISTSIWEYLGNRPVFSDGKWITASSTLVEGNTRYSADKMGIKIGECWVEGEKGTGIGVKLTVKFVQGKNLTVSNGFVSFAKPNLYKENARIKTFRITNEAGKSEVVTLKDTPHFQVINSSLITYSVEGSTYTLEILDVYPGTKYEDTCINSMLYRFSQ
ncbi:MAG: hypothetical protein FWG29_09550 [Treponema sp.]|nr:hypothetical protein [Treponema sp.]